MVEAEQEIRKMARINKRIIPPDYFKQFQVKTFKPHLSFFKYNLLSHLQAEIGRSQQRVG